MSDSITVTVKYNELLDSIKQTLAAGQLRAARAVNTAVVETYCQIGREIVIRQREQGWGAKVTERLSADLRTARPDMRGLSARNLRYMAALASRWPHGNWAAGCCPIALGPRHDHPRLVPGPGDAGWSVSLSLSMSL